MNVRILNIYNNLAIPELGLQGSHGEAFWIEVGDRRVLFDTGWKPKVLLQNMRQLGRRPDEVEQLVISHGHRDHTGGLKAFLEARTTAEPLPVFAHPDVRETKALQLGFLRLPLGFPVLPPALEDKLRFQLTDEVIEIVPGLFSLGEIPLEERTELTGAERRVRHRVGGAWEWDPVIDDLSLALKTDGGLVIVTGCCHAGLLNTCGKARRVFDQPIRAVIGGTHMMNYSAEQVAHVGDVLESEYSKPAMYLNHCTGKGAIAQLKKRFGPEVVHDCWVGSEQTYRL